MSRSELAQRLGVGVRCGHMRPASSAPRSEVLLRLFNALEADPTTSYRGSYSSTRAARTLTRSAAC